MSRAGVARLVPVDDGRVLTPVPPRARLGRGGPRRLASVLACTVLAVLSSASLAACGDDAERPAGPAGTGTTTSSVGATTSMVATSRTAGAATTTVVVAGTGATGPAPGDGSGKDARPPGTNPP